MTWLKRFKFRWILIATGLALAGCAGLASQTTASSVSSADPVPKPSVERSVGELTPQLPRAILTPTTQPPVTTTTTTTTSTTTTIAERPPVELTADDLLDRRLETFDVLVPPVDEVFVSMIEAPAPTDVIARSTWHGECPVAATDLAYAQVSFFGFDGEFHTGELLVHRDFAADIVDILARMHEVRFPIEEMSVVSPHDLANPTAEENNTSVFTCRRTISGGRWSRHAYGDAIDINPFHNPYVSSSRVIPELATAYVDRERQVPGLIDAEIRSMFADIGWGWGGNWNSVKDWMHFSATGD